MDVAHYGTWIQEKNKKELFCPVQETARSSQAA
jgi:hypothetical protein